MLVATRRRRKITGYHPDLTGPAGLVASIILQAIRDARGEASASPWHQRTARDYLTGRAGMFAAHCDWLGLTDAQRAAVAEYGLTGRRSMRG